MNGTKIPRHEQKLEREKNVFCGGLNKPSVKTRADRNLLILAVVYTGLALKRRLNTDQIAQLMK